MGRATKYNITKSLLQSFIKEGLSREQMAKKVGCSVANINLKMSEFDLVKRRAKRGTAKKAVAKTVKQSSKKSSAPKVALEMRKLLDLYESLPSTEGAKNLRAALSQDMVALAKKL